MGSRLISEVSHRNTESYIGTLGLDLFGNIDRRPPRQYFPEETMSTNDAAQVERMQQTDGDAAQAISGQTDRAQRFVFEDLKTGEDAHLVIVSTSADGYPITAKKITTEARASKWLGQMSDQSLQTLSRNKWLLHQPLRILLLTGNQRK